MTSILKKFVCITEESGASIEEVEIPSDIKGDEDAELCYVRELEAERANGSGALWFTTTDVINMANYVVESFDEDDAA